MKRVDANRAQRLTEDYMCNEEKLLLLLLPLPLLSCLCRSDSWGACHAGEVKLGSTSNRTSEKNSPLSGSSHPTAQHKHACPSVCRDAVTQAMNTEPRKRPGSGERRGAFDWGVRQASLGKLPVGLVDLNLSDKGDPSAPQCRLLTPSWTHLNCV